MNATVYLSTPSDTPSRNGHPQRNGKPHRQKPKQQPAAADVRKKRFEEASENGRSLMGDIVGFVLRGDYRSVAVSLAGDPDIRGHLSAFFARELSDIVGVQVPARPHSGQSVVTGEDVVVLFRDFFVSCAAQAAEENAVEPAAEQDVVEPSA